MGEEKWVGNWAYKGHHRSLAVFPKSRDQKSHCPGAKRERVVKMDQ